MLEKGGKYMAVLYSPPYPGIPISKGTGMKKSRITQGTALLLSSREIFPAQEKGAIGVTGFSLPAIDKLPGSHKTPE